MTRRRFELFAIVALEKSRKFCNHLPSMPSPVGHAAAGMAAAFLVNSFARRPALTLPVVGAAAALAVTPDLDLLIGSHRTYTHSVAAVAAVWFGLLVVMRARHAPHASAVAVALAAAYATHLLLDWFSKDTAPPSGLTALWPFSSTFYQSPWTIFSEISRRYWLPHEFFVGNILAAGWECLLIGPLLVICWVRWSRRTLSAGKG